MGKRFYKQASTREADDGNGWTVMLDYRTLKTPSKRPLKLPTLSLAKAIAAEWEYQVLILSHQPKLDFCWPLNLLGFIKNCSFVDLGLCFYHVACAFLCGFVRIFFRLLLGLGLD